MKIGRWGAVAVVGALLLAACGDDDGDDDEAAAGAGDPTEYCELSAALDEQDCPPTQEQLEELEPGFDGMACFVESGGEPHILKGMRIAFEVS